MINRVRIGTLVAAFLVAVLVPGPALADRSHRVRAGQTWSGIARRYGVTATSLAGANRMGLTDILRTGQVLTVPDPGVTYVPRGQTLSHIARAHGVSIRDLARANRIRPNSPLQVGQRLELPGGAGGSSEGVRRTAPDTSESVARYGRPARPGRATFVHADGRQTITLIDHRGRVRRAAINQLSRLMRHRNPRRQTRLRPPPRRLLALLARVSDHFGGRAITIVSGYRPAGGYTRESSQHTQGHAVDIRVQGVPNTELRDFCRSFDRVGVGFYPNSSFVHFDVRDRSTYWVDYSGPGEAPRYAPPGTSPDSTDSTESTESNRPAGASEPPVPGDDSSPATPAADPSSLAPAEPTQGAQPTTSDAPSSQ